MNLSNRENLSATKVSDYIWSGFSMSTISSCKSIENNHNVYRDKDRIEIFCKPLRKHAMEIINFEKKFTKSNLILVLILI